MQPIEMNTGDEVNIAVVFDWTRDNVTKDWSVTAWGTNSKPEVTHSDASKTSQKLPEHTDDKSGLAPP